MQRKKPDVDIINDVLKETMQAYPASTFVESLHAQYQERGGLSKKQLEGLYQKALKVPSISIAKLATLEAEILKRPTRYRSPLPPTKPMYTKDVATGELIIAILEKYPQHKRVLYYRTKFEKNEILTIADIAEINRFYKLLK